MYNSPAVLHVVRTRVSEAAVIPLLSYTWNVRGSRVGLLAVHTCSGCVSVGTPSTIAKMALLNALRTLPMEHQKLFEDALKAQRIESLVDVACIMCRKEDAVEVANELFPDSFSEDKVTSLKSL